MNKFVIIALVVVVFGAKGDAEEPVTIFEAPNILAVYRWTLANRKPVEVLKLMKHEELAEEIYPACVKIVTHEYTGELKSAALDYVKIVSLVAREKRGGEMPYWIKNLNAALQQGNLTNESFYWGETPQGREAFSNGYWCAEIEKIAMLEPEGPIEERRYSPYKPEGLLKQKR